ncbi:choline transporter-like protein 1 [Tribolium madens]|uniref:choline transporter-like protein 1 n=1 Tax=Tribolium madens TaxID=41895 RepID=UPI001CF76173|nr:choline transporter-like protein 1 [Tribolium madens]
MARNQAKPIVVENIPTFRRSQSPLDVFVIPELSQKRKLTDVPFLITLGICVVILMVTMIYTLCYSDINRVLHGYDYCGNVCGEKNSPVEGIPCSGQDMTNKPYLEGSTCVENCRYSDTTECSASDVFNDFSNEGTHLAILCCIGLVLSIIALLCFRYFVDVFVWTMLIGAVLLMFALTGFVWYRYAQAATYERTSFLISAIILTFFSVIFSLFILLLTVQIKLIIRFYEETIKIVFAMPLVLLEPVLTFISLFVIVGLCLYTFVLMVHAGKLQEADDQYSHDMKKYEYVPDGGMIFATVFAWIMMLWMVQFVLACQQMVISGAVSNYYFTRDKLALVSPIYSSFYNLIRYHLGSVAFGSLIITAINILKIILRAAARENGCMRLIYICCFRPLEDLVKYMTSMGYIVTAIHGQPLCRSSVRAVNLIISNLLSAVAMNSIGNFVFFMVKLFVVAITALIGYWMKLSVLPIVIGAVVAFVCIHCIFVVFEVAVDTVLICYCEDNCVNNGTNQPFYATVEFYQQVKQAQALTKSIEAKKKKK